MGTKIHGECFGCHHEKVLVIEEKFCSEACERRAKLTSAAGNGFVFGLSIGVVIGAMAAYSVLRPLSGDERLKLYHQQQDALTVTRSALEVYGQLLSNKAARLEAEKP